MAATNFTPISLYYSTTASAVPTSGNLVAGELALNTLDEKLYFKNSAGTVKLLASNAASTGTVSSVAATVPAFLSIAGSPITTSGTLAITLSGTALPVANGGTGLTTTPANGALDIGNGTGFTRTTLTAGTGVTITNASGAITINATGTGGTVTSVAATVPSFLSITGSPITTSGTLAISLSGTALPTTSGGTGLTSFTSGGVVYASSSSVLATGSALTFNGTTLTASNLATTGVLQFSTNAAQAAGSIAKNATYGLTYYGITGSSYHGTFLTNSGAVAFGYDSSGNLGLGVTPSAWSTASSTKAFQISSVAVVSGDTATARFRNNIYTASSGLDTYITTNFASDYAQNAGRHLWFTAASGTAGTTATMTQAMTLDASGNLLVGTTTANGKISVYSTANVSITIDGTARYKGFELYDSGVRKGYFNIDQTNTIATLNTAYGTLVFATSDTERARIDSSGNFLVGATTALVSAANRGNITINGTSSSVLAFGVSAATKAYIYSDGTNLDINNQANGYMTFDTNALERARIDAVGNVLVGGTAARGTTVGTKHLDLFDGTAPAGTLTNGVSLYSSSGDLKFMNAAGTDFDVGYRNIPQNSQSAAYTLVLADAGKHIFHPSTDANARTYTIPANSSVAYPIGTAITFINMTSQVVTIAITTDTMYLSSAGTTGSRSLAQYGSATAIKMTSTTWLISGSGLT